MPILGRRFTGFAARIDAWELVANNQLSLAATEVQDDVDPHDGALGHLYCELLTDPQREPSTRLCGQDSPHIRDNEFDSRFEATHHWVDARDDDLDRILACVRFARNQQKSPIVIHADSDALRRKLFDAFGYRTVQSLNPIWWSVDRALVYGFK